MISPLEIRKLEFNKKFKGYDPDEVHTTLDSIAKELENQIKENTRLSEKFKITEERLNHFRLMEKTLQDSVITMQTTLDEKRKSAEQEAELIIQEAKLKAASEISAYSDRIHKLQSEILALENQRSNYFARFKNFLRSQLEWMEAMKQDEDIFHKDYNRTPSIDKENQDLNQDSVDFRNAKASGTPATTKIPSQAQKRFKENAGNVGEKVTSKIHTV
ncbi:MAG: DivIVA domain-containing protein [Fibrobacteria bacterium]|nr:DivIVA domain-containing protein [Fibrobacteria bacterium]